MPIRLAIVDDYEVVVRGLAEMLRPYAAQVELVPLDSRVPVSSPVDIALVDTAGSGTGPDPSDRLAALVADPQVGRVVVYSWNTDRAPVDQALEQGAAAYLSKTIPAADLVAALQRVHAGESLDHGPRLDGADEDRVPVGSWPGREHGLTAREAEVIAMITQGLSNQEIAERSSLSINSVKSYIRTSYRKMGVTSRTNAVLWGLDHGFSSER
jgi:DNA-binding NarL/FixJ family response regulator